MLVNVTAQEVLTVVTGTGQAVADALVGTPNGTPQRVCLLIPGLDVAWDNCQCGQLAQVIVSEYLTNAPFDGGASATVGAACGLAYRVVSVATSLVRCVPMMDPNGKPPKCSAYLTAGINDVIDRTAVRLAVLCHLESLLAAGTVELYSLGAQTTLGEQGGCAGSVLTWSVALVNRCPC